MKFIIEILKIREQSKFVKPAAIWFHSKWGVPIEAYEESMRASIKNENSIPQWYVAIHQGEIIGGLGVIENDFHSRKELSPNVCAVYVEESYRGQGLAGQLLDEVCSDMQSFGIDTLYLITDHTSFYEKYGWEFLCMVQGDGESEMTRMYIHSEKSSETCRTEGNHLECCEKKIKSFIISLKRILEGSSTDGANKRKRVHPL